MNKKIFTLFLVVAASAVLAVSCNNKTTSPVKEPTTEGTTETTPTKPSNPSSGGTEEVQKTKVELSKLEESIKALATVTSATKEDAIEFKDATIAGGKIALTAKDKTSGGDNKVTFANLKTALNEKLTSLKLDGVTISNNLDSQSKPSAKTALKITLTVKPADSKHELDKTTFEKAGLTIKGDGSSDISLEITPNQDWE